jgi:hypothetical protein
MVCGVNPCALRRRLRVDKILAVRARKLSTSDSSDASSDEDVSVSLGHSNAQYRPAVVIIDRKEARKIRNRESAMRSRNETKKGMEDLQRQIARLERDNARLREALKVQPSIDSSGLSEKEASNTSAEHAKFFN